MSESLTTSDRRYRYTLTLGALGVVFGDIGTSPLYAMRECFYGPHGVATTQDHVLGVLSLIIWSLIFVVSIKYIVFVLRADNKGEGGVLALLALLAHKSAIRQGVYRHLILVLGLFGAALLYGDGVITPAISVLSAVEGLSVVTPLLNPVVVPTTLLILVALFFVQKRGTASIGKVFGPIILLWFIVIGLLGLRQIILSPSVLWALNPVHAISFLSEGGMENFKVLGAVFLVCTGAEALYADMGHFGRSPIRTGWFAVVLPGLLLNYFGQGALLLSHPAEHITNPFFQLAPSSLVLPLVILSTISTVIASQALISGAFSLTRQAVQLGYLPRVRISHTSSREIGQIYIPVVNWILLTFTCALVLQFRTSSNLAAAYGIAVSLTMVITTILLAFAARHVWHWNLTSVFALLIVFLVVDLHFLVANSLKILDGGWVPLVFGGVIYTIMSTWHKGRHILAFYLAERSAPLDQFIAKLGDDASIRVPGVAVFMSRDVDRTPAALVHNLKHNRIVHKTVLFLRVITEEFPVVSEDQRIAIEPIKEGFYRVTLRYGFVEDPDVPKELRRCKELGLDIRLSDVTFFLGRESVLPTRNPGMALWREGLFAFITSVSARATSFFHIPPEQVIEIGYQVEI